MAKPKKNQMAQILFPIVDGTDYATIESGITASDFESKMTKKFFGVNHGVSTAFTSGTISKAATLVRSGIFQQTLKASETNYDYVLYSFAPANTSLAQVLLAFEMVDNDDSDLMSYLVALSGMISDTYSLVSDVDSQVNLVATSNYLSQVHSDLYSAIGGVTATVSASNISDIASAVWAGSYSILGAGASSFGSLLWGTVSSRVSDIQSYLVALSGLVSDVYSLVSDVDSQVNLVATSNYLSQVHSDLRSQIGGIGAGAVTASDISDIVSAVWAGSYSVLGAAASSFGSLLWTTISKSQFSDIMSNIDAVTATVSASDISDITSAVWAYPLTSRTVTISASDMSDIRSAIAAGPAATVTASDISDIASAVWAAKYTAHSVASSFGSLFSDVYSRLALTQSNVSDVLSALDSQFAWTSNYLSGMSGMLSNTYSLVSDVDSQLTLVPTSISASDMSDIVSRVWAAKYTAHSVASSFGSMMSDIYSRMALVQSNVSDIESQLDLTASVVSDVQSALDSQYAVLLSNISDIDSQLLLNASMISDIDSQIDAGVTVSTSSISDIASRVLTTALTEAYATDGSAFTLAQALYMIWGAVAEFSISSTTLTVKKLDGTTTAMTFTLDDATNPTSRTRAT